VTISSWTLVDYDEITRRTFGVPCPPSPVDLGVARRGGGLAQEGLELRVLLLEEALGIGAGEGAATASGAATWCAGAAHAIEPSAEPRVTR
jgi:hypothetical protein